MYSQVQHNIFISNRPHTSVAPQKYSGGRKVLSASDVVVIITSEYSVLLACFWWGWGKQTARCIAVTALSIYPIIYLIISLRGCPHLEQKGCWKTVCRVIPATASYILGLPCFLAISRVKKLCPKKWHRAVSATQPLQKKKKSAESLEIAAQREIKWHPKHTGAIGELTKQKKIGFTGPKDSSLLQSQDGRVWLELLCSWLVGWEVRESNSAPHWETGTRPGEGESLVQSEAAVRTWDTVLSGLPQSHQLVNESDGALPTVPPSSSWRASPQSSWGSNSISRTASRSLQCQRLRMEWGKCCTVTVGSQQLLRSRSWDPDSIRANASLIPKN